MSDQETASKNIDAPNLSVDALEKMACSFLNAAGFSLQKRAPGVWLGEKAARAPGQSAEIGGVAIAQEAALDLNWALEHLAAMRAAGAARRIPIVTQSRKGLDAEALRSLKEAGGALLSPLQFFDWHFRRDQADAFEDGAIGIDRKLRAAIDLHLVEKRAPQPYRTLDNLAPPAAGAPLSGADLLEDLADELASFPQGPRLRVISGNAGVGKTVLINALTKELHDNFNRAKRRSGANAAWASRPLLFTPRDLGATTPQNVDALIEQVFSANLAAHVPPAAFRWLNHQGFSTWIFDGLDEFYRRQNDFFPMLRAAMADPNSRAQIIICTRDSLLTSSDAMRAFLAEAIEAGWDAKVHELAHWNREAKEAFVAHKLFLRGVEGDWLERRVQELMRRLDTAPALGLLTDLPFYADLYVESIADAEASHAVDEFALLQSAVDALIERERGKLSIDWDVFVSETDMDELRIFTQDALDRGLLSHAQDPMEEAVRQYGKENLEHLLGAAAHICLISGDAERAVESISLDEWRDVMADAYIGGFESEETEARARLALTQFAFFSRAEDGESITFVHELIAEYLAAKYAISIIALAPDRPAAWRQALGSRPLKESAFRRYLLDRLMEESMLIDPILDKLDDPLLTGAPGRSLRLLISEANANMHDAV